MASYAVSDIHGRYDLLMELLNKINLKDSDTLYVIGDILDRGPNPIKTLLKLMEMPNAVCIVGNHELMATDCLRFLNSTITDESLKSLDIVTLGKLLDWQRNGSDTTISEFRQLSPDMRDEVMEFMLNFSMYEEVSAGGQDFLLVHAGLGDYEPGKDIDEYSLKNLVWDRADYETQYFDDIYVVSGHTPTQFIEGNPKPGYIYKHNNHIAIDCGCYLPGGRLACICLDTQEEFYVS